MQAAPPQAMFNQQPTINITTKQIQKLLDENRQLIMAIMQNQNLGKYADSVLLQAQLQENLIFLAKVADAQSPATMPSQMPPLSLQQEEHAMHPSQATMTLQPAYFAPDIHFQPIDQKQQYWQ